MAENMQRGLLKVVSDLGVNVPVEADRRTFQRIDPGWSEVATGFAAEFAGLGKQLGRLADHAAAIDVQPAGHLAGMDPEFRPQNAGTIRSEAFDKAGLQTALARVHVGIVNDVEDAHLKYLADPAKLKEALDAKRSGWLSQSPVELHPEIETLFAKSSAAVFRTATREMWGRQAAELKGATAEQMDRHTRDAQQRAYGMGLDRLADQSAASDAEAFRNMLARKGIDGNYLIPPAQQAHELAKFKENQIISRVTGVFSRLPSPQAKAEFATQFDEGFAKGGTESPVGALAKDLDIGTFKAISAHLRREIDRDLTQGRVAARGVMEELKYAEKQAAAGNALPRDVIAGMRNRIMAQAPEMAPALDKIEGLLEQSRAWQAMTPAQLDPVVRGMRAKFKDAMTPERESLLKLAEGQLDNMHGELKKDPIGWAEKVEVIAKTPPIDMSNPAKLAETLKFRIPIASEVASRYGIAPKFLRPDEARALGAQLAKGGDQAIAIATAIASAGPERAQQIMGELDKEHAGHLALLGLLVANGGDQRFIAEAANGIAFQRTEGHKNFAEIKPNDMYSAAHDVVGSSMDGNMVAKTAAMALANKAYEMWAQQNRPASFDKGEWQKRFRAALGEHDVGGEKYGGAAPTSRGWLWNSSPVVIPPNIAQRQFDKVLDAVKIEDVGQVFHEHGKPVTQAELRGATLVQDPSGTGRYRLTTGQDRFGRDQVFVGADQRPFVLDLNKLEPVLRTRVPSAYLGAAR